MRFVPMACTRDGMIVAKTVYGRNGEIMLAKGVILKNIYIQKLVQLGYQGLYIEDDISRDIVIAEHISENLRMKTVRAIKDVFIHSNNECVISAKIDQSKVMVENIIDEILQNKNLMVNMIDLKVYDDYTFYHCVNVAVLSIILGVGLSLDRSKLYRLGLAALLHDIGKVFVKKSILDKKGKLTEEEFEEMQNHSKIGYEYLKDRFDIPLTSYIGVLEHHEKFDGTGYPLGKKGTEISLFGRIIAIADVYDALTSDRPYRKALLPAEGIEYIMGGAGVYFDLDLVSIFVKKIAAYPIGTLVKLSNGYKAIVVNNSSECCTRPKVRIINDGEKDLKEDKYLDLSNDFNTINITVVEVLNA